MTNFGFCHFEQNALAQSENPYCHFKPLQKGDQAGCKAQAAAKKSTPPHCHIEPQAKYPKNLRYNFKFMDTSGFALSMTREMDALANASL